MAFEEILMQAVAMLQRLGRVSYRALKRQFDLDDDYLDDLKEALIYAHPQVADDGRGLVWTGDVEGSPPSDSQQPSVAATARDPDPLPTLPST